MPGVLHYLPVSGDRCRRLAASVDEAQRSVLLRLADQYDHQALVAEAVNRDDRYCLLYFRGCLPVYWEHLIATDEEAAVQQALKHAAGRPMEVWRGGRRIACFRPIPLGESGFGRK